MYYFLFFWNLFWKVKYINPKILKSVFWNLSLGFNKNHKVSFALEGFEDGDQKQKHHCPMEEIPQCITPMSSS